MKNAYACVQLLSWFSTTVALVWIFHKGSENAKAMKSNQMNLNTRDICFSLNLIFELTRVHYYDA